MAAQPALAADRATSGLTSEELAFWERAFLSMAPQAIAASGWTLDNQPATSGDKRMELCAIWADLAVARRRERCANP